MKKIVVVLFVIMVVILSFSDNDDSIVIPDDAIRFRIIANSNSLVDQKVKNNIKEELMPIISDILNESNSKEDTIKLINYNMDNISEVVHKYVSDYSVNYGLNYFPEKYYRGLSYSEGEYESLVITLGSGFGDNWWCVLFPPLCLLEAEEDSMDNYSYSFYIKEIIDKYSNL